MYKASIRGKTSKAGESEDHLLRVSSFPCVVPPVVPEGAAADGVDDDEEDEEDDVEDGDLLPLVLDVGNDAGLAGAAVVAEGRLIVVPRLAVGVV